MTTIIKESVAFKILQLLDDTFASATAKPHYPENKPSYVQYFLGRQYVGFLAQKEFATDRSYVATLVADADIVETVLLTVL